MYVYVCMYIYIYIYIYNANLFTLPKGTYAIAVYNEGVYIVSYAISCVYMAL